MRILDLFKKKKPANAERNEYVVPQTEIIVPVNRRERLRVNARAGTQVLIIDDSATVQGALGKILQSAGYIIHTADNAEAGLEMARGDKPNLIFLDIMLPGMHGFSALRKIRRDAQLMDIPVIVMSGHEKATEHFFSSQVAAEDFMKKPFSRQEVFARIERLLDQKRIPRRLPGAGRGLEMQS
ncbi:response regulator [Viridibacterium curvum]|uniref:Response regulatory domain-containing protein n=1 Tax=Viridibacterium curvum TaxID=1101404 RepID=A0ABP9QEA6_9RHOO